MGLLKAGIGALSGVLADSWREYFYCESMAADVLCTKGVKRTSSRSSNTKGEENIISNGSIVAVNEGQAMMIVEQGAIVEFCAEAGEFVWDSSTEPSIFYGKLGENIKNTWNQLKKRFTMGGDTGKDQRVYYFNTKEIVGNKYGTANPVPFRVVDNNIGLDMDIGLKCFGEYSYKITDPMLFYKNVCGNVTTDYKRSQIDSQLKSELLTALQPAFARISEMGIRYSAVVGHTTEIADALNQELSGKWSGKRGIEVSEFGISSMSANEEDEKTIKDLQKSATLRNPNMAAAHIASATADAMKTAAGNENGAMMGFMGMNMAQGATSSTINTLFQQGQAAQYQQQPAAQQQAAPAGAPAQGGWDCPACGAKANTGKFCVNCGAAKPVVEQVGWTCSCGAVNKGKFCPECGAKKPANEPLYKCDKCGWEPSDPKNPPKFCPECGDPFNDEDITNK